ncbi:MAG: hypothetical protein KDD62_15290, partial [Bdellovibrionales bacterium]|nr:hypothetical protein [Bdellovibrionales bacterium]
MGNPFVEGEHQALKPSATALVIFGASGDLTQRKLLPALYNLAYDGLLPDSFIVVGASRTAFSDEEYREKVKESVASFSRRELDPELWERFSEKVYYHSLDGNNEADFVRLRERLEGFAVQHGGVNYNYVYYLATSPNFFSPIAKNLSQAGLVEPVQDGKR